MVSMPHSIPMTVTDEVAAALASGHPVVALETAVVTCGLPRAAHAAEFRAAIDAVAADGSDVDGLEREAESPLNLAVARTMSTAIRARGAIPAIIAIVGGRLHIGLDDRTLTALAADETAGKASTSTFAGAIDDDRLGIRRKISAGTTVAATLAACRLAPNGGIRWFATGGIGGVHRHWTRRPDVSADLGMLASGATSVVCAGAKSILDIPATLEMLETLGIPVVGFGTDVFPRFHALGQSHDRLAIRRDDRREIASLARIHGQIVGRRAGVLVVRPVPAGAAIDESGLDAAIEAAEAAADQAGANGAERTPWLLDAIAERTGGATLKANIALLIANAILAAEIATADDTGIASGVDRDEHENHTVEGTRA